jgi:hypothetical protein
VRIVFRKVSDHKHVLEIVREDGRREEVECDTRSYLHHDLLHYAAEAEAGLEYGFWGNLASGRTLSEMNDRTGETLAVAVPEIMVVEKVVGALSNLAKGRAPEEIVAGVERYYAALGSTVPPWFTGELVSRVRDRMRQLLGRWKATAYGGAMDLAWPAPSSTLQSLDGRGGATEPSERSAAAGMPGAERRHRVQR